MIRTRLKMTSAALGALLLAAFVAQSHAAMPTPYDELEIAPSLAETGTNAVDDSCMPPSDLAECTAWHQVIRANFSPREIGMLFGSATSYPEYATAYARNKARYARLHDEFVFEQVPAHTASIDQR